MIKKLRSFGGAAKNLLFSNQGIRQTVAKNTFWLGMTNIGGRLLRAIIIVYAARVLGAAEWGIFSYAMSLIAFLAIFLDFGMGHILTREISKTGESEERAQIFSTSTILKLSLLALGIIVVATFTFFLPDTNAVKIILPIAIFIMAFDTMREFGFALIHALQKMEWETGLFFLTNIAIVVFGFVFLNINPTVRSFAISYAFGTFIGAAATAYVLRDHFKKIFSRFTFSRVKPILASAWPFAVSGALGMLLLNTDILLIGWFRSATDVGLYSASIRIIQLLYLLPTVIATSTLPILAKLAKKDDATVRNILEKTVSISFLAAIPMAVGGFILGFQIISFVFGSGYILAVFSFQILMLSIIVDFPVSLLSNAAFAYDRQKNLIIYAAIGGFSNVIFDLVLIPRFGITGSAFATLFAQIISNIYLWQMMKKINHFAILPYLKNIILATVLMSGASFALLIIGTHVLVNIATSVFVYFGILYVLKEPLLKELRDILRLGSSASSLTP